MGKHALRWGLVALGLAYVATDAFRPEDNDAPRGEIADTPAASGLAIVKLKPVEVPPGGATVASLAGLDARDPTPITASIDKKAAEVLYRRGNEVVVRLPESAFGRRRLRVQQGDRRSKGYDVWVKPLPRRKGIYGMLGGFALFVLGLRTLQGGLRAYAGGRLKNAIARYTGSLGRGLGIGVLAGAVTQSSASAAGVLVSLIESELLALGPALSLLLGAQLGTALTLLVLPLGSAREGLLVVALGVALLSLAKDRRGGALASMLLGIGLLQYGVQLLRNGLQPFVADPALLPYVKDFSSAGVYGLCMSAAAGVAVTALTQGPGALFALTLGLAQSSGLIGVREALALLSGAALGSALGAAVVVWPFGPKARRLALGYLLLGAALTLALLCSLPAWTALATALPGRALEEIAGGPALLSPRAGMRLALGFVSSQLALALAALPLLPSLARALTRRPRAAVAAGAERLAPEQARRRLGEALAHAGRALEAIATMTQTCERAHAAELDAALREARTTLDGLLEDQVRVTGPTDALGAAAVAMSQLYEALAALGRLCERGIEEGVEPESAELHAITALHARVLAALEALGRALSEGSAASLEGARVLEIQLNAEERDHRHALTERLRGADTAGVARSVHVMSVLAAYETVGNHLFRAHEALAGELD